MTRKEQRIASIRKKIHDAESALKALDSCFESFSTREFENRRRTLLDRREMWEERLVWAETGPLKVYSRA